MGSYTEPCFRRFLDGRSYPIAFEIGSRDGLDALKLQSTYGAEEVHVFEPNSVAFELCRETLAGKPGIHLQRFACWDKTGEIPFFPVEYAVPWGGEREANIGASSCFRDAGIYGERLIQSETTVPAIRLDEYCLQAGVDRIDLLCMDTQGAAYNVLLGLGGMIGAVSFILTELETKTMYDGEVLFGETDAYLRANGFELLASKPANDFFGDFLYRRKAA